VLEVISDEFLILGPPFGFIRFSSETHLFPVGHGRLPPSLLEVELDETLDRFESGHNAHPILTPTGHHEQNASSRSCAEVQITLLSLDDFDSEVHRIVEDDLLCLLRLYPMARDVLGFASSQSNSIPRSSTLSVIVPLL
jgi:hypothetical protein